MTEPSAQTPTHPDVTSVGRLIALSDGIFAIAMTLLVIDVAVPPDLDDAAFHRALRESLPSLGAFALSFTLTAGFWRDHRRILTGLRPATTAVTRVTLLGLGLVALLPFPTALLAEYASQPAAVVIYASAMTAINAAHVALLVLTQGLVHPEATSPAAAERRRFTLRLAVSGLVFALSIPLAFADTRIALYSWITLIPAQRLTRLYRRRPAPPST